MRIFDHPAEDGAKSHAFDRIDELVLAAFESRVHLGEISACAVCTGENFVEHRPKNVGDFQAERTHFCRPSSLDWSRGLTFSVSNGLWIDCSRWIETRRYFAVVRISPWPSRT